MLMSKRSMNSILLPSMWGRGGEGGYRERERVVLVIATCM